MSISDLVGGTPPDPNEHQEQTPPPEEVKESAPLETQWTSAATTTLTTPIGTPGSAVPGDVSTPQSTVTENPAKSNYDTITDQLLSRMGDIGVKSNFKIMIYGEPGSTKSTFLGTAPDNFIYDVEDGLVSIKNAAANHGLKLASGIQTLPYRSFTQFALLVDRFRNNADALKDFKVFSVDTMSELHKRGLQETTEAAHKKTPTLKNEFVAETEEHTENNERITRIVRSLRDMDRDLIIIAHARTVEPKGKASKTFPDFSEKLANSLMSFMDVVGYMEMRDIEGVPTPILRVVGGKGIAAKNRMGLPPEIANPNYLAMRAAWEKMSGDVAQEDAPVPLS